jgi:hypothetical protein
MIIKLDMENAFDQVRHSFLFELITKLGFIPTFIQWICSCTSSPWIAPLVNGRPTSFFQWIRGLRSGCLISPLLYIIMIN